MNQKPLPSRANVKGLATRLKNLWAPDQSVRPFLRKHTALFRELQRDGWSWAGLALGMNKAGITYRTAKPWTADTLMQAFSRAQVALKDKPRPQQEAPKEAAIQDGNTAMAASTTDAGASFVAPAIAEPTAFGAPLSAPVGGEATRPAPRFKPVSFRPREPLRVLTSEERAEIEENRRLTFGGS